MSSDKHDDAGRRRERMRTLIEEIACCPPGHYCTLKEILCRAPRQAREILQIKCVEKFKYERSQHEGRAIDWHEALDLWIAEGYAAAFDRVLHEGSTFIELFRAIASAIPPPADAQRPAEKDATGREKPRDTHKQDEHMRALIEDIACCPHGHYCTLKEVLCRAPRKAREILQIKCVEKFKYERSHGEKRAIEWHEAFDLWIAEGYAAAFAVVFHDGIAFAELYRAVMQHRQRGGDLR